MFVSALQIDCLTILSAEIEIIARDRWQFGYRIIELSAPRTGCRSRDYLKRIPAVSRQSQSGQRSTQQKGAYLVTRQAKALGESVNPLRACLQYICEDSYRPWSPKAFYLRL